MIPATTALVVVVAVVFDHMRRMVNCDNVFDDRRRDSLICATAAGAAALLHDGRCPIRTIPAALHGGQCSLLPRLYSITRGGCGGGLTAKAAPAAAPPAYTSSRRPRGTSKYGPIARSAALLSRPVRRCALSLKLTDEAVELARVLGEQVVRELVVKRLPRMEGVKKRASERDKSPTTLESASELRPKPRASQPSTKKLARCRSSPLK